MKKSMAIPLVFSSHFVFAGTGGANDEPLLILSFMAVILSILVVLYSIEFTRRFIKKRKEKRIAQLTDDADSEDVI